MNEQEIDSLAPPEAKKPKLEPSLDPLKILPFDVFDLIFQHLKNEDVLAASEVSPSWFKETEKSTRCIERLHLKVCVPYCFTGAEKCQNVSKDLKSSRNYQNIFLNNVQSIVPEVVKIIERGTWKKVFLSSRHIKNKDFQYIMKLIESTVENLSISSSSLEDKPDEGEAVNFSFPKLKNLDLSRCFGMLMKEISEDCRNLNILKIDLDPTSWKNHESSLRKILIHNDKIEKLSLWRCSANIAFQLEYVCQYRFKLKAFVYKNGISGSSSVEEGNCLYNFLESQADSLECLRLEEWFGIEVFKLLFRMPKLRELTIDMYDTETTIDWDNIDLSSSSSITKFHLDSYRKKNKVKIFDVLFSAMPCLKFLTTDHIDDLSLASIGPRCQLLEELEIQELRATAIDDPLYFPSLKRFHCEDRISMTTKRRINLKPASQRSRFEQLVLTAKPYFVTK